MSNRCNRIMWMSAALAAILAPAPYARAQETPSPNATPNTGTGGAFETIFTQPGKYDVLVKDRSGRYRRLYVIADNGDMDNDGMPDWWESQYFGNTGQPGNLDFDNDLLSNAEEYTYETDPTDRDTDNDLLLDGTEVKRHLTIATKKDTDNDGRSDGLEIFSDGGGAGGGGAGGPDGGPPVRIAARILVEIDGRFYYTNVLAGTRQGSFFEFYYAPTFWDMLAGKVLVAATVEETDTDGTIEWIDFGGPGRNLYLSDVLYYKAGFADDHDDVETGLGDGLGACYEVMMSRRLPSDKQISMEMLDSDFNGIYDGEEDFDGDGLWNVEEYNSPRYSGYRVHAGSSDLYNPDTDGDLVSDGPLDPDGTGPILSGPDAFPLDPSASVDTDDDGYPNQMKIGVPSNSEPLLQLDKFPNHPEAWQDTDGDGKPDDFVSDVRTTPLLDLDLDDDGDGLLDLVEIQIGLNPKLLDTDGDQLPDGWEEDKKPATDPLSTAYPYGSDGDYDTDGLSNLDEFKANTDPRDPDSDDDGLTDKYEVKTSFSNPNVADSDNDGMEDRAEALHAADGARANTEDIFALLPLREGFEGTGLTLKPAGLAAGSWFGWAADLELNNGVWRAVIGAPYDNSDSVAQCGAAYRLTWQSNELPANENLVKLQRSDSRKDDYFGFAVDVCGAPGYEQVVVGAPGVDHEETTAYGYRFKGLAYIIPIDTGNRNVTEWTLEEPRQDGDNLGLIRWFGRSVAISDDGHTVVVGADGDGIRPGRAYVFVLNQAGSTVSWVHQQTLMGDSDYDYFGYSVAISGDRIIVGEILGGGEGAAYVYKREGMAWQREYTLKPSGEEWLHSFNFGSSVAIENDTIVVGAPKDKGQRAYVFTRSGSVWTASPPTEGIRPWPEGSYYWFGYDVDISGDKVIVGASEDHPAYVFSWNGVKWNRNITLADRVERGGAYRAVALVGDTAVVGAPMQQSGARAYLYHPMGSGVCSGYIDSQNNWRASPLKSASVQTLDYRLGNQALAISAFTKVWKLVAAKEYDEMWISYWIKPGHWETGKPAIEPWESAVYYLNSDRNLMVRDRMAWRTGPIVPADRWMHVVIRENYLNKTWRMWLDGAKVVQETDIFGFANNNDIREFSALKFTGGSASTAYIDDIRVSPETLLPHVDILQSELIAYATDTSAQLNLTADSAFGAFTLSDLGWSSAPAGISGSGTTSITFNPSLLVPGNYIVRARITVAGQAYDNYGDSCVVRVLKKVDIKQEEKNVLATDTSASVKLTDESIAEGLIRWEIAPVGMLQVLTIDGPHAITFNPSALGSAGRYIVTVRVTNNDGATYSDTCVLRLLNAVSLHPNDSDFVAGKVGRVVMAPHGGGYYTQKATARGSVAAQIADGIVRITAHVMPADVAEGATVYFRVVDPDDLSPYERDDVGDDNFDPTAGILNADTDQAKGSTINGVWTAAAEVELSVSTHASGDNYLVECSLDPDFSVVHARTSTLVTWRRVYLEVDKMYRTSSDLATDFYADVDTAPDTVTVRDGTLFSVNDNVVIFDAANPAGETAVIVGINGNEMALNKDLAGSYNSTEKAAAVANTDDGVFDFDPLDFMTKAYGNATDGSDGGCFVEVVAPGDGDNYIPHRPQIPSGTEEAWFKNRDRWPFYINARACDTHIDWGLFGGVLGNAGNRYFNVYVGALEEWYVADSEIAASEVAVHELGHLFGVSSADDEHPSPGFTHEAPDVPVGDAPRCQMSYLGGWAGWADGVCEFCDHRFNNPYHLGQIRSPF